jgi:hypothetical protein
MTKDYIKWFICPGCKLPQYRYKYSVVWWMVICRLVMRKICDVYTRICDRSLKVNPKYIHHVEVTAVGDIRQVKNA